MTRDFTPCNTSPRTLTKGTADQSITETGIPGDIAQRSHTTAKSLIKPEQTKVFIWCSPINLQRGAGVWKSRGPFPRLPVGSSAFSTGRWNSGLHTQCSGMGWLGFASSINKCLSSADRMQVLGWHPGDAAESRTDEESLPS